MSLCVCQVPGPQDQVPGRPFGQQAATRPLRFARVLHKDQRQQRCLPQSNTVHLFEQLERQHWPHAHVHHYGKYERPYTCARRSTYPAHFHHWIVKSNERYQLRERGWWFVDHWRQHHHAFVVVNVLLVLLRHLPQLIPAHVSSIVRGTHVRR